MGFSKKEWIAIDSYVAPLGARTWDGRSAHIEAAIKQARKYLGKPYIVGASSSPAYGNDCSGLVMQSLYAGGLNLNPVVSSIHHAYPGNEWNSKQLWATSKLRYIPAGQRQRGDLIFFYSRGSRSIDHVGIYLGNNQMVESWPDHVQQGSIYAHSAWATIAGYKRAFN
ncbi:NlpC/P60 family protein [Pediococcus argentinicus]|uniref:C40 family peptidase n=1 Tax=Pediococcus argentinicus TaxID=480391 RepID=UPI0033904EAC